MSPHAQPPARQHAPKHARKHEKSTSREPAALKNALRILLLLLAVAAFGWLVRGADPEAVAQSLAALGFWAPLVPLPYLAVYLVDTVGWWKAFGRGGPEGISYGVLFRIRWMGESINNFAPSAYVGGEAVKVYLLAKRGLSASSATASVVIAKTLQMLGYLIFLAIGALGTLHLLGDSVPVLGTLLSSIALTTVLVAVLFWVQRRGPFGLLLRTFERFGWHSRRLEAQRENLLDVDQRIVAFYRDDRGAFRASLGAFTAGWLLDTLEIFLVAGWMDVPLSWNQALVIEAFTRVAKAAGVVVPGAIGVQEAGIVLMCRFAGAPDAFGIRYAVLRRGREALYAAVGWLLLIAEESHLSQLRERLAQSSSGDP